MLMTPILIKINMIILITAIKMMMIMAPNYVMKIISVISKILIIPLIIKCKTGLDMHVCGMKLVISKAVYEDY